MEFNREAGNTKWRCCYHISDAGWAVFSVLIVFDYVENNDLCSKLVFLFGKVVLHQQNWTIFYGMTYHFFLVWWWILERLMSLSLQWKITILASLAWKMSFWYSERAETLISSKDFLLDFYCIAIHLFWRKKTWMVPLNWVNSEQSGNVLRVIYDVALILVNDCFAMFLLIIMSFPSWMSK